MNDELLAVIALAAGLFVVVFSAIGELVEAARQRREADEQRRRRLRVAIWRSPVPLHRLPPSDPRRVSRDDD